MSTRRTISVRLRKGQLLAIVNSLRMTARDARAFRVPTASLTALTICERALAALDARLRT